MIFPSYDDWSVTPRGRSNVIGTLTTQSRADSSDAEPESEEEGSCFGKNIAEAAVNVCDEPEDHVEHGLAREPGQRDCPGGEPLHERKAVHKEGARCEGHCERRKPAGSGGENGK